MRALLFLLLALGAAVTAYPVATAGDAQAAAALLPLVQRLGGRPMGAVVEVYAGEVTRDPNLQAIARELLSGARWSSDPLGAGRRLWARAGSASAEIVALPLARGNTWLMCARVQRVPADRMGVWLAHLPTPPCGARHEYAAVTARVPRLPTKNEVSVALRRIGARQPAVLFGPAGLFALAYLPHAGPSVHVGGEPMNLALSISYDMGRGGRLTVATPTLSGVGSW